MAAWLWDHSAIMGDARFAHLARLCEALNAWFDNEGAVRTSLLDRVDALFVEKLNLCLSEENAALATQRVQSLGQEIWIAIEVGI